MRAGDSTARRSSVPAWRPLAPVDSFLRGAAALFEAQPLSRFGEGVGRLANVPCPRLQDIEIIEQVLDLLSHGGQLCPLVADALGDCLLQRSNHTRPAGARFGGSG